ncbi:glycosyltransferase [Segetibacter koreensis]|uniref:glycosyltransferase n=1 Tax=Segetibacter koreensis TaxID=398037 RepID=UPI0003671DA8|nr:nucleotide disphospho-sugar-binding domain-containing protein [Segetibacter koreensis]
MKYISSIQPGTKILFANFPADGHFNPLTGLAVHLKNIGCDVRWYTSKTYAEKIARLDIPFYGLQRAVDVSAHAEINDVFPERKKYKGQVSKLKFDMINAFILRSTEYYEDILEIYEEFPFQLMIADITFGAIPFVEEKMNIPVISISVVPLPETSKDLAPSGLGITPSYSFFGKIKQSFLRFIADELLFAQPTKVMWGLLAQHGIDAGKANIFDILIQKSTLVLQSGTPGFEYKRSDLSSHVHFIGPLLPYTKKKERESWYNEKLSHYDKVILVTQGTIEKDIEKLIVPTLEAFKNSDCLVIATTGGAYTEELRKRYPEENIIIEDFIPFDDVMPYADVYVSNGGYGGVLLSIQHQLPMVVAGVHEGKNEINARVGYFDLGINLKTERPTVLQLRKSVDAVLQSDSYAKNVKRLGKEFKQYDPNEICEKYVAQLLENQISYKEKANSYQAEVLV